MAAAAHWFQNTATTAASNLVRLVSLLLPLVMVVLTLRQRSYLAAVDWDPVSRTSTQWPSLLAVGPQGWILTVAFLLGCAAMLAMAATLWLQQGTVPRWLSACFLAAAIGFAGISFAADPPGLSAESWHAMIHNAAYPLIPIGLMAAAVVLTFAGSGRRTSTAAATWFLVLLVAFGLTNVDAIAQLARFFAFALLLAWVWALTRWINDNASAAEMDDSPRFAYRPE